MSLFKNLFIAHDIMKFEDDYLILHCSREDYVKAPFDGDLTIGNTSCILSNGDFQLFISHVNSLTSNGKVKAGQFIAKPLADNKYGHDIAYILVKLYKGNQLKDILKYLKFQDNTIEQPKKIKEKEIEDVKHKSSNKKKTNKKNKNREVD